MTLEELRMRIAAAFPEVATTEELAPDGSVSIRFGELLSKSTEIGWCGCSECLATTGLGWSVFAYSCDRPDEVERRILSVTSHDMIAARRRLTETAP